MWGLARFLHQLQGFKTLQCGQGIKGGEGNRVPQVDRQVIRPLFLLCKDPHKRDLANMLSGPGACGSGAGLLC